jgi:hypothetical protein
MYEWSFVLILHLNIEFRHLAYTTVLNVTYMVIRSVMFSMLYE